MKKESAFIKEFKEFISKGNVVDMAVGVVGVDDDDGPCFGGDLLFDIFNVGVPVALLVADVVNGLCACKPD